MEYNNIGGIGMDININNDDYKLLLEMMGEDIQNQVNWLKTKKEPHYKLFNAGQIKAFEHVLTLIAVNDDDREAI